MPEETIRRQINACNSNLGTETFDSSVIDLFNMLPEEMRSEIEKVEGVCKLSESYVNRFINNVLVTVEFVTTKTFDHNLLFSEILKRAVK
jgi:hypothetical protein